MPQDKHLGVQNKTISKKRSTSDLDDEHWRCLRCKCPGHLTPVKRIGPDGNRSICNACYIRGRAQKDRTMRGSARPILSAETFEAAMSVSQNYPGAPYFSMNTPNGNIPVMQAGNQAYEIAQPGFYFGNPGFEVLASYPQSTGMNGGFLVQATAVDPNALYNMNSFDHDTTLTFAPISSGGLNSPHEMTKSPTIGSSSNPRSPQKSPNHQNLAKLEALTTPSPVSSTSPMSADMPTDTKRRKQTKDRNSSDNAFYTGQFAMAPDPTNLISEAPTRHSSRREGLGM